MCDVPVKYLITVIKVSKLVLFFGLRTSFNVVCKWKNVIGVQNMLTYSFKLHCLYLKGGVDAYEANLLKEALFGLCFFLHNISIKLPAITRGHLYEIVIYKCHFISSD